MLGLALIRRGDDLLTALYDGETDRVAVLDHQPADWAAALALLAGDGGATALDREDHADWIPAVEVEVLPPIGVAGRVVCVAQNYRAHAQESSGTDSPPAPVIFLKPSSALVGHHQPTVLPKASSFFDWEAELGVVVGASLDDAGIDEARAAILGYTIANDGTARDLQPIEIGGRSIVDWFSAKSIDRSSVLGPAIFPSAHVDDGAALRIRLELNGDEMQNDVAGSMVFSPEHLLSHISRVVSLHRGDILLTGTPAGVGKARGVSLRDGDDIVISVEPLGRVVTRVTAQ